MEIKLYRVEHVMPMAMADGANAVFSGKKLFLTREAAEANFEGDWDFLQEVSIELNREEADQLIKLLKQ